MLVFRVYLSDDTIIVCEGVIKIGHVETRAILICILGIEEKILSLDGVRNWICRLKWLSNTVGSGLTGFGLTWLVVVLGLGSAMGLGLFNALMKN